MKKLLLYASAIWIVIWLSITIPIFWVSAVTYRIGGIGAHMALKLPYNNLPTWIKKLIGFLDELTTDNISMKQFYLKIKNRLCNIPSDKYLHALVSLALVQLLLFPCCAISKHLGGCIAIILVMAIGFLKELFDKYVMHTFIDHGDLKADFFGAVIGHFLSCLMIIILYSLS